jgi:hypothetical protein
MDRRLAGSITGRSVADFVLLVVTLLELGVPRHHDEHDERLGEG